MIELYYTAPTDEVFEEVKQKAIELWPEVDIDHNKFGYATEKINQIKDIQNVSDNMMYVVAMFNFGNQRLLADKLSEESKKQIRERMIDGGTPLKYIYF